MILSDKSMKCSMKEAAQRKEPCTFQHERLINLKRKLAFELNEQLYKALYICIYMVFTTEGFSEVAIES